MNKLLIAASLVVGLGGFVATSAAYADDFSGVGQHPRENVQIVENAQPGVAPDMTSASAAPSAAAWNDFDVTTKSHGHP